MSESALSAPLRANTFDDFTLATDPAQTRRDGGLLPPPVDCWLLWQRGGNTGDRLIISACQRFLADRGLKLWCSDGSIEQAVMAGDREYLGRALENHRGLICFAGGGNIGIYPGNGELRAAVIQQLLPHHRVLVFSQSAAAVEPALVHPQVTVWCRERASFDLLTAAGVDCDLVPDMSLYLADRFPPAPPGTGTYFILRSPGADAETIDYVSPERTSVDLTATTPITAAINTLAATERVVSSRMHGGLIAAMLGKPVVLLPTGYHKVKSTYDTWFAECDGVGYAESVEDAAELIQNLPAPRLNLRRLFVEHAAPAFARVAASATLRRSPPAPRSRFRRWGPIAQTCGVCLVRDSVDVVPYLASHYLRLGLERVHFIDDGSSDGTYEWLDRLARRTKRVSVERAYVDADPQGRVVSAAANDMIAAGFRLVVPFDADEFWTLSRRDIRRMVGIGRPTVFRAEWVNFVQRHDRWSPTPWGLLGIAHRAPATEGVGEQQVVTWSAPFVSLPNVPKVALWADDPIEFLVGQHAVVRGPDVVDERHHELWHIPLRWKSELSKRSLNYEPRRALSRAGEGESWQSRFFRDTVLAGRIDDVWAANSVGPDGHLGSGDAAISDTRLQHMLLRATWYRRLHRLG